MRNTITITKPVTATPRLTCVFMSIVRTAGLFVLIGSAAPLMAAPEADEQCPAVNCDCEQLPDTNWIEVCKKHEQRIKNNCVANANTPRDYCLIHGLNAKPLPLELKLVSFAANDTLDLDQVNEKIRNDIFAVGVDIGAASEAFNTQSYTRTLQILKFVSARIEGIFKQIQQVDAALSAQNLDPGTLRKAWAKYAADMVSYGDRLKAFAEDIESKLPHAASEKDKKIYSVLAQKAYRMAGQSYEHAGYAYGQAGESKNAARLWKQASELSVRLAALSVAYGGQKTAGQYAEYQAAARLQRASYHWLLANSTEAAKEELKESTKYVNRVDKKNLDALMDSIDAAKKEEGGILNIFNRDP